MKVRYVSLLVLMLTIGVGMECSASELYIDNMGYVLEDVYGDSALEGLYGSVGYYDCYVPYKKLIGEIGGFTVDVYGLEESKENDAVGDLYRYMDYAVRLEEVGSRVGSYSEAENIGEYFSYTEKDTGLSVYEDENGNEYYGVCLPRFFFNEGSLEWGREVIGQVVDVVYNDGTVIHCVVDDLMWESQSNGWGSSDSIGNSGFHTEISYSQYASLFDDVTGEVFRVVGRGSSGFVSKYDNGSNELAYVRVYETNIFRDSIERVDKSLDYKYEGKVVFTGSPVDEVIYSGEIDSDEYGRGKKKVASTFSEETQKIVEAHCLDFNVKTFEEFMRSQGGYINYLKKLGGVFEKFAGDDVKIPVKTAGDYKVACEYVFGIICIWGFDYSNGDPGHYGRWRSGDGVTESNVTDEAFYPRGYNVPYEFKDKYAAPRRIDLIASQEGVKQKGVNTCCNFCVDLIRNKIQLADFITTSEGKQPGTCSVKTQRVLTEKLTGKPGIFSASELKVGDLIHCYRGSLSSAQKSDANATLSGWYHVLVVGEIDEENGTITLYETGHDLTNDGNFKNTVQIKNGLPFPGWVGTRWFNIDESTEVTLGDFTEGNTGSLSGSVERVPEENELVGMPSDSKISDSAKVINKADYDSLTVAEKKELQNIKLSLQENSTVDRVIKDVRVFVAFIGLWLMLYMVFLNVAFLFDKSNNFIDISLLSVVTLGVISKDDEDIQKDGMEGYLRILKISAVMFVVSITLLSGSVYLWMFRLFRLFTGLL